MKKDKKPKNNFEPKDANKTPKMGNVPTSPQNLFWSYSLLDEAGPFGWHECQCHEKYYDILKRKKNFEGMTYQELVKTGSHPIETYLLSKDARDRLETLKLDDFNSLFSLRLTGANRIWCVLDKNIMRVLWWDPEHLVYPVEKKNT